MRIIAGSIVVLALSLNVEAKAFGHIDLLSLDVVASASSDLQSNGIAANSDESSVIDGGTDSYPRVSLIENAILGKTFPNDDLEARLVRLETKAFGKASSNTDLGDRTDELQVYAEKKSGKKLLQEDPGYESAMDDASSYGSTQQDCSDSSDASQNQPTDPSQHASQESDSGNGEYPHITDLENAILHKSFPGEPVENRLGRLENTAFGAASSNPDLSVRIDALDAFAEKKLHIKPYQQDEQERTTSTGDSPGPAPSRMRQVGTMVGTSLINMAGMGLPGFGGVRVRNRADVPPEELNRPAEPQDDPLVFETNPPPAGVKMLTKVGWCEVQVFGHTFPAMHLPQRLSQLNTELKYAPNKTGIALMDSTEAMIKAAQIRKQLSTSQPVGQN